MVNHGADAPLKNTRRGGALLRPRRQGKAAALPCPRMPTVVGRPALRPPCSVVVMAQFRGRTMFAPTGIAP